jgi:hypothetical protein
VLGGDEGGVDALAGVEVDALPPLLTHDLPQEILDHAPVGEEEPVAEVVLSHDFPGRDSTTVGTAQVAER